MSTDGSSALSLYSDFLSPPLLARLLADSDAVPGVAGLRVARGLRDDFPTTETEEALSLVCAVYRATKDKLAAVLKQRRHDRAFCDAQTAALVAHNRDLPFRDPGYRTVIGLRDEQGKIVCGPSENPPPSQQVQVPAFLQGEQITLFGPPDTARLSINAMNALHRKRPDEPALVEQLVAESGQVPRWGADDEDSKTPIMSSFLRACENLQGCFAGTLSFADAARGRTYKLAGTGLALPIKRIPGLALPDGNHLLDGQPLPLHLFDLVLHIWHNRHRPQALVLYVPKLETEHEAAYLRALIDETEAQIQAHDPTYQPGHVRVILVFENPRAIFRIREMAAALGTHFLGGSLGWHDFLASTARLFRNDPRYRIPVKADPNIVINNIRESHRILVRDLGPMGALKIGGMYGVLPEEGNAASHAISLVGFIKDVTTQLRRGLDGFWIAHPDFVRIAIALVHAYRRRERDLNDSAFDDLIQALVPDADEHKALQQFLQQGDAPGLSTDDPRYARGVLAADLDTSPVIANHDPEEVRYNIFQALQYLADWLSGNGCVALPATLRNARGEHVFVRIMDDLATTERSRWELWAEVQHGRVAQSTFDTLLRQELAFLRASQDTPLRRIQVRWQGEAARWYPIAARLLHQLVTSPQPPEFVTELALPFTFPCVRDAADPWQAACDLCPEKFVTASAAVA